LEALWSTRKYISKKICNHFFQQGLAERKQWVLGWVGQGRRRVRNFLEPVLLMLGCLALPWVGEGAGGCMGGCRGAGTLRKWVGEGAGILWEIMGERWEFVLKKHSQNFSKNWLSLRILHRSLGSIVAHSNMHFQILFATLTAAGNF
jgi:hypothetical protein